MEKNVANSGTEEYTYRQNMFELITDCLACGYKVQQMENAYEILFVDEQYCTLLGYASRQEFQEKTQNKMEKVIYLPDLARIRQELALAAEKTELCLEYRVLKKNGKALWIRDTGKISRPFNQLVWQSVVQENTELKAAQEALRRTAEYDELTGLYNRKTFYREVAAFLQSQPSAPFEIMYLDVERFKALNDLFGEAMGNRLILYIADCLKNLSMADVITGRFLSDNFVLCFQAYPGHRQKIMQMLQKHMEKFSIDYQVIIGFGIYKISDRRLSVHAMCERAKLAFREGQSRRYLGNCGEYDERLQKKLLTEHMIVNEMGNALAGGQFKVYLQPKFDLHTEQIVGAEALVRWDHPTRGLISPAEFVPVFERNGFIMKLDEYIWEEVCCLLRKWKDEGRQVLPISVNVSRFDLYNENLCDILEGLLQKYDIEPKLLGLEITESAYMENPEQIIGVTRKLQNAGFSILMDDFGSGYSSLNMLKDVPVDILKIDMHFLDGEDTSDRGNNILHSVVRMAEELQTPVITEGVETQHQVEFLRQIGCHCVQGYYYSKPVAVHVYERLQEADGGMEFQCPAI